MFSYERHDDSGSWEMKCITRVQLYKYQQLLFCLLLGIISQCILTTSKFMVIKFDKICLKMMLFLHSASLQQMIFDLHETILTLTHLSIYQHCQNLQSSIKSGTPQLLHLNSGSKRCRCSSTTCMFNSSCCSSIFGVF